MKTVLVEPLNISKDLLEELKRPLEEDGNIFVSYDTKPKDLDEWLDRTRGFDQVILANTKMPDGVIDGNDDLKYINIAFTGFDHVNVKKAKEKNILVSNARGYSDQGVSELVIGMILNIYRKINGTDGKIREGYSSENFMGLELEGKTVGIIGTGNIGHRLSEILRAFGVNLLGYDKEKDQGLVDLGMEYVSLDELLSSSDIVSLHLPLNDENISFMDFDKFKKMKKDSIFINCARGPIVNTKDLVRALEEGEISYCGIDVFDYEPPLKEDYPLLKAKNTLLTPHVAYFTMEAMEKRARIVFKNALSFINGEDIGTLI